MGTLYNANMSAKQLQAYYGPKTEITFDPTADDHGSDVLYEIKKDPVVGRFIIAKRDIQPGEVIFTDQPACVGPDNSSKPMCLGCHRKVDGSYKCPGCKWPMCREACTRLPAHVAECQIWQFRKAVVNVPWFDKQCAYYDAILPMRVLLLKYHNPKVYHLVSLLMDHNDNLDEGSAKHRKRVVDFIRKTCKLANDFSEEEVNHVMGILTVNSFVVHDSEEDHYDLIGLYPWTSLMSHNCIANTKITTRSDFSYVCEAATFIRKGEEIVTSYHHYHYQFYGTQYRRMDLKNTWNFECLCSRCGDATESGTKVSGVFCDKCRIGIMLPLNPLDFESKWRCDGCDADTTHSEVEEKVKKYETELDSIKGENSAEEYEKLLRRMKYVFSENHYWILDVKRRLIDIYGKKPGYEVYKLPPEMLEKKVEYVDHLLSVCSKLCPGKSEMKGYLLWESHTARVRLVQWRWIRMKINTQMYLQVLEDLAVKLKEIIQILGPIRPECEEGQMGLSAKEELKHVGKLIDELACQSKSTSTMSSTEALKDPKVAQKRRSICL